MDEEALSSRIKFLSFPYGSRTHDLPEYRLNALSLYASHQFTCQVKVYFCTESHIIWFHFHILINLDQNKKMF